VGNEGARSFGGVVAGLRVYVFCGEACTARSSLVVGRLRSEGWINLAAAVAVAAAVGDFQGKYGYM
jgi:hypothetical protein